MIKHTVTESANTMPGPSSKKSPLRRSAAVSGRKQVSKVQWPETGQ